MTNIVKLQNIGNLDTEGYELITKEYDDGSCAYWKVRRIKDNRIFKRWIQKGETK